MNVNPDRLNHITIKPPQPADLKTIDNSDEYGEGNQYILKNRFQSNPGGQEGQEDSSSDIEGETPRAVSISDDELEENNRRLERVMESTGS